MGDNDLHIGMSSSKGRNITGAVMVLGLDPLRNAHFNKAERRRAYGVFERCTRARIATMSE